MAITTVASTTRSVGTSLLLLLLLCCDAMVTAFVVTHCRARGWEICQGKAAGDKLPFRSRPVHRQPRTMEMDLASLFFSFGQKNKQKTATRGTEVADRLSAELFSMLTDEGARPDDSAVMSKIEELEAAPGVTFNKDYLYDGPWRVLWKTNTEWQRYFDPLNGLADNKSYQWYKEGGSVTNIAQALGEKLYVTVDGQGAPASESTELPYEVNVEVSRAWLHAFGGKVPLDFIKGKGTTFVVYNDAKLRVFRSDTGGTVVQTKADEVVPV